MWSVMRMKLAGAGVCSRNSLATRPGKKGPSFAGAGCQCAEACALEFWLCFLGQKGGLYLPSKVRETSVE